MASDVIYFTVLFLSFSFLSPSLLPYLFMMFAVNGSGLSGPVVEILILPTTAAATASTAAQKRHHLWAGGVVWHLSSRTSSQAFFCCSCQFPVRAKWRRGPAVLQVGRAPPRNHPVSVSLPLNWRLISTLVQTFELDFMLSSGSDTLKTEVSWFDSENGHYKLHFQFLLHVMQNIDSSSLKFRIAGKRPANRNQSAFNHTQSLYFTVGLKGKVPLHLQCYCLLLKFLWG